MEAKREPMSDLSNEKTNSNGLQVTGVPRNRRELRAALALSRSKTKLARAKNRLRSAKRR